MGDVAQARHEIRPTVRQPRSAVAIVGWAGFSILQLLALDSSLRIVTVCACAGGVIVGAH